MMGKRGRGTRVYNTCDNRRVRFKNGSRTLGPSLATWYVRFSDTVSKDCKIIVKHLL